MFEEAYQVQIEMDNLEQVSLSESSLITNYSDVVLFFPSERKDEAVRLHKRMRIAFRGKITGIWKGSVEFEGMLPKQYTVKLGDVTVVEPTSRFRLEMLKDQKEYYEKHLREITGEISELERRLSEG